MLLWVSAVMAWAGDDLASLCADRAAIERVYYNHRLGEKPAFESAIPPTTIQQLVHDERRKESVLRQIYHVEISPALVEAEARRIEATSRAPEVLGELKAALAHDPARFARAVARPLVVERELRARFEDDSHLHAALRRQAEQGRAELLAAHAETLEDRVARLKRNYPAEVSEVTWQLGTRSSAPVDRVRPNSAEPSGGSQPVAPVDDRPEGRLYFADLPAELQKVLRAQLRQRGDVSAVIETPRDFRIYVAREKTDAVLAVTAWTLPKRSFDEWLKEVAAGL